MTESRTPRPDPEKSEEPIEFVVEGDRVRGTLYLPAQAAAPSGPWRWRTAGRWWRAAIWRTTRPPSSSRAWRR